MQWLVGTSGYSYKEWKGNFYPEKLAAKKMLAFYGEKLPAVEINSTFYRMPKASVLESWCEQVPEHFRFSIKASRRITHLKRLKEVSEETTYLLETVQTLGARLGVVLFQLPPNMKCDLERFDAFLDTLPAGCPGVFEFRHETWFDDAVYGRLKDRGLALCLADNDDAEPPALIATADRGYLRLRRAAYSSDDLARWRDLIADQGWSEVFVFFKHEDEGTGPRLAGEFLELTG